MCIRDSSTAARRQLGGYSSEIEQTWRQQARAGEWGNYTINQLKARYSLEVEK